MPLTVVEDCAQAAGASYRGRKVGSFGHASLFSFQLLKGINTYGGGMSLTNDDVLAERIRAQAESARPQTTGDLVKRLLTGLVSRSLVSPKGFTFWGFPIGAVASVLGNYDYSKYIWEKIRPLDPFPRVYRQRYSNVQAVLGLRALAKLDEFNAKSRAHAAIYTNGLAGCRAVQTPHVLAMSNTFTSSIAFTVLIENGLAAEPSVGRLISKLHTSTCVPLCRSSEHSRRHVPAPN